MQKYDFNLLILTEQSDLLEQNREYALQFKENLTALSREILQPLEEFFNCDVKVLSALRCPRLNEIVGGSKTGEHLTGCAVDFVLSSVDCEDAFEILRNENPIKYGQLILEKNETSGWLHISLAFPYRPKYLCGQSFKMRGETVTDFKIKKFYD